MYSVKNVFTHEPSSVKAVIVSILAALIATDVINISTDAVAMWGVALELILGLFYVRQTSVPIAAVNDLKPARRTTKRSN